MYIVLNANSEAPFKPKNTGLSCNFMTLTCWRSYIRHRYTGRTSWPISTRSTSAQISYGAAQQSARPDRTDRSAEPDA